MVCPSSVKVSVIWLLKAPFGIARRPLRHCSLTQTFRAVLRSQPVSDEMKQRYQLFKRGWGTYYFQDTETGKQQSLKTRDKHQARALVHTMNEALRHATQTPWQVGENISTFRLPLERRILKVAPMRLLLILVTSLVVAAAIPADVRAREDQRLDSGWHFTLVDVSNAMDPGFDDSGWQRVSLPHNWGWEEAQQGKDYYRGPGWYRRELEVTPEAGKRYFLRFEAASLVADVYLNGKLLGEHRGGFGAFCFEITNNLSAGGTNLLAVRVDNTKAPGHRAVERGFFRLWRIISAGAFDCDQRRKFHADRITVHRVWSGCKRASLPRRRFWT